MFDAHEMPAVPGEMPVQQSMPLPAPGPQSVHLLDRLNAVFKHRRLAGTAFVLVVAVMMIQTYSTVPMYETSARLQIEDEKSTNLSNLNENNAGINYQDPAEYKKTQFSILRSRGLGKRVVERLDLVHSSMFNGEGPRPRDPISLMREARGAASTWVRSLVSKPAAKSAAPEPVPDLNARQAGLIDAFIGGIDIKPEADTRLVYVTYRHSNPSSRQPANAVVEEFALQNLEFRVQNTQKLLEWVSAEVDKQGKILADNEGAMAAYRETNNAISLENKQNIVGPPAPRDRGGPRPACARPGCRARRSTTRSSPPIRARTRSTRWGRSEPTTASSRRRTRSRPRRATSPTWKARGSDRSTSR
jgi:uncharacterized protein involved in exopolysaccharide biosynthesis